MQEEFIEEVVADHAEYNELADIMKSEKSKAESILGEIYFAANFELKGSSWYD